MKYSIVVAYYNRVNLLYNFMNSVERLYANRKDIEIVVVDDSSNNSLNADLFLKLFNKLNIHYIKTTEYLNREKNWSNPVISYNIGFKEAKGENIIFHAADNLYLNDFISYIDENPLSDKMTYNLPCFSLSEAQSCYFDSTKENIFTTKIEPCISYNNSSTINFNPNGNCWWVHDTYRNRPFFYLGALIIKRNDLYNLNGMNELLYAGYALDDDDLAFRLNYHHYHCKTLDFKYRVYHQYHGNETIWTQKDKYQKNLQIFNKMKETYPSNEYFKGLK